MAAGAALRHAEWALECGTGLGYVTALPAKARVLLVRGADEKASTIAAQAEDVARARRNRVGIAEAPEIEAAATGDAQRRAEATRIWRDIGNPFAEARAELALARASGGTAGRALRSSPKHATSNTASLPACPSAPADGGSAYRPNVAGPGVRSTPASRFASTARAHGSGRIGQRASSCA